MRELQEMNILKKAIDLYNLRTDWLGAGGQPVPLEQAQARADVCLKCPMNQERPIYEMFTGKVARTILSQIQLKDKMGLKVRNEASLHVCQACQCILKLKVQAPLKFIVENTPTDDLHPDCWISSEQRKNETTGIK